VDALTTQADSALPDPPPNRTAAPPGQVINVNPIINVAVPQAAPYAAPASTIAVVTGQRGTNMLVRMVWFLLVGWWLGALWLCIGLALMCTLIGIPIGLIMLNGSVERWWDEQAMSERPADRPDGSLPALLAYPTSRWAVRASHARISRGG
jgi:hypothetical protein